MDPDSLATRALGTSLMPAQAGLIPAAPFGAIAEVLPQNPAQVLANLMDFPGSVALAELLETPLPPPGGNPEAAAIGAQLLADVRARLDALATATLKPLTGRRSPELPTVDELELALQRHRIEPGVGARELALLADALGGPFREALGTSLRKAQAHVATLRFEITQDLRRLGPRADRLERIDAALARAINAKLGELLDRMELAAQATFARACARAVEASFADDAPPRSELLAAWSAPDGWIARYHERCVRMAKALYGHLRRSLEGLVRAAIHAEET
jgi:hypothetical protein